MALGTGAGSRKRPEPVWVLGVGMGVSQAWVDPDAFPVLLFGGKQGKAKLPAPHDIFRGIKSRHGCRLLEAVKPKDFNKKGGWKDRFEDAVRGKATNQ